MRKGTTYLAGMMLTSSLLLAAEPTTESAVATAWKNYQADPAQGKSQWDRFVQGAIQAFQQQVLLKDTEVQGILAEMQKLGAAMQQDTALMELKEKVEAAKAAYEALDPNSGRSREIALKRRELESLQQQLQSAAGKYLTAMEKSKGELARRGQELMRQSDAPAAVALRELNQLREAAKPQRSAGPRRSVPAAPERQVNPFADLFARIPAGFSENQPREAYAAALETVLKKENPNCSAELIRAYARMRNFLPSELPVPDAVVEETASEPFEEVCRALRGYHRDSARKEHAIRRIRRAVVQLPRNSASRFDVLRLLGDLDTQREWRQRYRSALLEGRRAIAAGSIHGDYSPWVWDFFSEKVNCGSGEWIQIFDALREALAADPWLLRMFAGKAAIDRAWRARGGGYADTVSKAGWQVFARELKAARENFTAAAGLAPNRPQPWEEMITVEMASGSVADRIAAFKKAIALNPLCTGAYEAFRYAVTPRWGGSHELILLLADTLLDYPDRSLPIPAYAFDLMGYVGRDYPDFRWKNIYLRPGLETRGDALFAARREVENRPQWLAFLLYEKVLWEMATLRYDQAAKTAAELGGAAELERHDRESWWNGLGMTAWFPRMPLFRPNTALELQLFTGKHGAALRTLEKRYLAGEAVADELAELIRREDFNAAEKSQLLGLYCAWAIEVSPERFLPRHGSSANPFEVAASQGYPQVAGKLLELGFDYRASEPYPGASAISIARNGVNPELLELLKKAGDPLTRPEPENGRGPIHVAAFAANGPMVRKLLELGISPTAPDRENHTPVQLAAARHGVDAVAALLAAGAGVDEQDNDGDTALMFVMEQNSPRPIWEALIRHSKNLNIVNHRGESALHYAARLAQDPEVIRMMLKAGADSRLKSKSGETPIDFARKAGKADFVRLLEAGQ